MLRKLIREDVEKKHDIHHNNGVSMMKYGGAYVGFYKQKYCFE